MGTEKYIVAASDNPSHIAVRNLLNPLGYIFMGNCSDSVSLIRLIRSCNPDFTIIDGSIKLSTVKNALDTIDDEMLCACIILGNIKDDNAAYLVDNSKTIFYCQKPVSREVFANTVEMAILNFRRISAINMKLREMTDNYETRKAVERAKWILMNRDGLPEKEAYDRIRKKSMDSRMSMKEIADAIITAYDIMSR